ncbi:MAG TPA: alpha/beta fold hydrolase [Pseudonocardia sp.]|nr:alpha/beta fold hydrolase [Pseudonocardia sp.]
MNEIYRSEAGAQLLRGHYLQALARWPVEHEEHRVPTPEGDTFVVSSGPTTADPLVLLHGSGGNSAQWTSRIAELTQRFRVYAIDIVGEPGLSAPARPPLDSDRYARWLDAVLDSLGLDRVPIMAVSLGGWVALDYGTRRPGRVERLALTCPTGVGRQRKGVLLTALPLNLLGEWGRRRSAHTVLGPGLATLDQADAAAVLDHVLLVTRHYRYRLDTLPVFEDAVLRRLTMPVHVLAGELDALVDSRETKRRLEALAPRATVHLLPGIGHFVPARPALEREFLSS